MIYNNKLQLPHGRSWSSSRTARVVCMLGTLGGFLISNLLLERKDGLDAFLVLHGDDNAQRSDESNATLQQHYSQRYGGCADANSSSSSSSVNSDGKYRVLVTGGAGFVGLHTCLQLQREGHSVIALDNLKEYYSPELKLRRVQLLEEAGIAFVRGSVCDDRTLRPLLRRVDRVIHLAAQAGVRHSIRHPHEYVADNVDCFVSLLESLVATNVTGLVYASSSSVYGLNAKLPFAEHDTVDEPASLYAATKRADELLAKTYFHLYGMASVGLRFFTVYGPWGRPDMAYYSFTHRISSGLPIQLYNHGQVQRDFTYIDDVVQGILSASLRFRATQPELINLGNHQPVPLRRFLHAIETSLNKTAVLQSVPMQPGDVPQTFADITKANCLLGYRPQTSIETGISSFVQWFQNENASRYAEHSSNTNNNTNTTNNNTNNNNTTNNNNNNNNKKKKYKVCFVTSIFGKDVKSVDTPVDVRQYAHHAKFHFFAFTNLQQLPTPGWEKIIPADDTTNKYKRFITRSRYGKFMAWNEPIIRRQCTTVFYADGWILPKANNVSLWYQMANTLQRSPVGLLQVKHDDSDGGILKEFDRIRAFQKDWDSNIEASIAWLTQQADFDDAATLYANTYFGYDPDNPRVREATRSFWDRYSLELDSWRDQPLWAYTLHRLHLRPILIPHPEQLWQGKYSHLGHNGHRYTNQSNHDAIPPLTTTTTTASLPALTAL